MVAEQRSSIVGRLDSLELPPTGLCGSAGKTSVAKLKVQKIPASRPGTKLFTIEITVCIARPVLVVKAIEPWKRFPRLESSRSRRRGGLECLQTRLLYSRNHQQKTRDRLLLDLIKDVSTYLSSDCNWQCFELLLRCPKARHFLHVLPVSVRRGQAAS